VVAVFRSDDFGRWTLTYDYQRPGRYYTRVHRKVFRGGTDAICHRARSEFVRI
jgi:hypothetical protein